MSNSKKSRIIKEQEASETLSQLGIRRSLSKMLLLVDLLKYKKMNAIIKKCWKYI